MIKAIWFTLSLLIFSTSSAVASQEVHHQFRESKHSQDNSLLLASPKNSQRVSPVWTVRPSGTYYLKSEPSFSSADRGSVSSGYWLRTFVYLNGWYEIRNGGGYRMGWIHESHLNRNTGTFCYNHPTQTFCQTVPQRTFLSNSHQGY